MNPQFGKRQWIKLWTNEWLDGTTRYQMSDAQRAFWIDLLAMAGRSRFPGTICAGKDGEYLVGYPLNRFQSLMAEPIDIEATLALFERTGKVKINITSEGPPKLYAVELVNWKKYQSDLDAQAQRSRNYRDRKKQGDTRVTPTVTPAPHSVTGVDERRKEEEKNIRASHVAEPAVPRDAVSSKTNPEYVQTLTEVWDYYIQKLGKNPKVFSFTDKRQKKGLDRLADALEKTGGDLAKADGLMRVAVDTLAASPFHRGENDRKRKYDSWEDNLFKSKEQFEKWLQRSIDGEGAE